MERLISKNLIRLHAAKKDNFELVKFLHKNYTLERIAYFFQVMNRYRSMYKINQVF